MCQLEHRLLQLPSSLSLPLDPHHPPHSATMCPVWSTQTSLNWLTEPMALLTLSLFLLCLRFGKCWGWGRTLIAALVQTECQLIYGKGYKGKVLTMPHSIWQNHPAQCPQKPQESCFVARRGKNSTKDVLFFWALIKTVNHRPHETTVFDRTWMVQELC